MHTDGPRKKKVYSDLPSKIFTVTQSAFNKGFANLTVIYGSSYSGKTTAVKEALDLAAKEKQVVSLYIAGEKVSLSPENFTLEFIGSVMRIFLGSSSSRKYSDFLNIDFLKEKLALQKASRSIEILESVETELQKIKPNQRLLLELAFRFAETLAKETKTKFVIAIDNFENFLDLNNFTQVKNIFSIFNFKSKNPQYILATSQKSILKQLPDHELLELKPIQEKEARGYIKSVATSISERAVSEIISLTQGYLPLLTEVTARVQEGQSPRAAYLSELLGEESKTYTSLKSELSDLLERARGKSLLRTILNVLARAGPKTLSEIAALIYRSAPVTKSLLERLIEVELIQKSGKTFFFSRPVLGIWLKAVNEHLTYAEDIDEEELYRRGDAL